MTTEFLPCDGCGQAASPEHIARRLQRLERTTRYRPVHIGTLLLGAISPQNDADFLYSGQFAGEAARLLEVTGIRAEGKAAEAVLSEFQRGGYFLSYLMDCPLEATGASDTDGERLLVRRVGTVLARVRRSLQPKRTLLFDLRLRPVLERLSSAELGCPVLLDTATPFVLEGPQEHAAAVRLRVALGRSAGAV
jgi:hypothetical protein